MGACGQVGRYLLEEFRPHMETIGTYCSYPEKGLCSLDITNREKCSSVLYEKRPTLILLPAAATHVDWCEDNEERCYQINVAAVRNVTAVARDLGSYLVLYSTDHVFNESEFPYSEEDPVAPINVYANSKVLGEQVVQDLLPSSHLILRTSWVYGCEPRGKNFALGLRQRAARGELVAVPKDQWGSPTYACDLARATLALIVKGVYGTYHVVGPAWMTRYEFALEVCDVFGLDKGAVYPVSTESLGQRARRPRKCRLDTSKFQTTVTLRMRAPQEGLRHMQKVLFKL